MAKVFVGLSGGVDSAVAARRLLDQGHEVVGVFIKVWQPDFLTCDWEAERLDAMRVAAHLGIAFLTCDAELAYKRHVGDYFVSEYLAGRTPNPDVMCNRFVKFGAFWEFARARGADYIATGHYAQVDKTDIGYRLRRGLDAEKDQSYFLWTLTQDDLAHTMFPIGDSRKSDIRNEAARAGIPTATKKDSQGICFLGHIDIPAFVAHFTTLVPGPVFDTSGIVIGEHAGALIYTLGQRHGFTLQGQHSLVPHFVVGKDVAANALIVDKKPPEILPDQALTLSHENWINGPAPSQAQAVFRYRGPVISVALAGTTDSRTLMLLETAEKPAPGQSVVFYDQDLCLGGAVVN